MGRDGVVMASRRLVGVAQIAQDIGRDRRAGGGLGEKLDGALGAAPGACDQAEDVQRRRIAAIAAQDLLGQGFRLLQVAGVEMGVGGGKPLVDRPRRLIRRAVLWRG